MDLQQIQLKIEREKALFDSAKQTISNKEKELLEIKETVEANEKARWIVTEVSQRTQKVFADRIETLVTSAIRSVFDDRNFEFHIELERKRNKFEARLEILEDGEPQIPKDEMGGGIVDVISFALRVVLWHLEKPRSRNLIYLDEPFRFTGALQVKAGAMVKEVSERLNIQFIINTHDDAFIEIADRCFRATYRKPVTTIEMLPTRKERNKAAID